MTELYSAGELERKNHLLAARKPLTLYQQQIIRCAESLLFFSVEGFFTGPMVQLCSGQGEMPVKKTLMKIVDAGFLLREGGKRTSRVGGTVPKRYFPVQSVYGEGFFIPAPSPDCPNAQGIIAEQNNRRTKQQKAVLSCFRCLKAIQLRDPSVRLTRVNLADCTDLGFSSVDYIISKEMVPDGDVVQTSQTSQIGGESWASEFNLTDQGRHVIDNEQGLQEPFLGGCILAHLLRR